MAVKMVVIDASVAAKFFLPEHDVEAAETLRRGERLIAPDILAAELVNVVWRNVRLGIAPASLMAVVTSKLPTLFAELVPSLDLAPRAGEIALALDHPAYDCFYIALAEREGTPLVTADRRLLAKARDTPFAAMVEPLMS